MEGGSISIAFRFLIIQYILNQQTEFLFNLQLYNLGSSMLYIEMNAKLEPGIICCLQAIHKTNPWMGFWTNVTYVHQGD